MASTTQVQISTSDKREGEGRTDHSSLSISYPLGPLWVQVQLGLTPTHPRLSLSRPPQEGCTAKALNLLQ